MTFRFSLRKKLRIQSETQRISSRQQLGDGYVPKMCGFFFLDVFAGTVRSGEKRGQQWSEVVVRNKINKLRNVCDDFVLVVASR